ncbi:RagB/SusD family nutrient uptake outer membrane protein [Spirosoma radiotolerans]|uniref:Carbohydrate-binding protein SusD n=1 Tax=Spirosoma radiotolerans TaxID=1379870 RepID=A0A0E3ZS59_9BACT|nr:RagB/SusD family nutrient uptake outer membrane protein [Spirosoma radiotolerans]AKD53969.1 carbohydrate-binding protein SusD [Spirosoma radiotolerans]
MIRYIRYTLLITLIGLAACQEVLEPKPVTLLVDELVLNEPNDVQPVRIGLYSAFRSMAAPNIIAGDFTADYIQANGTYTDEIELGTKRITATNGAVDALWSGLYRTIYVANFILERLPALTTVPEATRKQVLAEARFMRGWANFIGVYTYGDIPKVTSTDQSANTTIPRIAKADMLASVLADYQAALADLPSVTSASTNATTNATYLNKINCQAALARYYLYQKNWAQAESLATVVINSGVYALQTNYSDIVTKDFTSESILEVGYNLTDDPGTSNDPVTGSPGLNNLLVGRREVIPSNQLVSSLLSAEAGTRSTTITFNAQQQRGNDNGWTVRKYGTASEDNNNIVLMRLAEMYLIRAEARAQQGKLTGTTGAIADLNVLRTRAKAPAITAGAQADVLLAVERERVYELAFEGQRWYDLVRTGRAQAVMSAFSPNWNSRYELWPIPQREIQQNTALQQNPGY